MLFAKTLSLSSTYTKFSHETNKYEKQINILGTFVRIRLTLELTK